jgi:F0F1-type ATP synthase assembly protein I
VDKGVNLRLLGLVGQVGLTMVVFIQIGLVVGRWIDARLESAPTFTLFFILLGVGGGAWSVARLVMWALEKTSEEFPDKQD